MPLDLEDRPTQASSADGSGGSPPRTRNGLADLPQPGQPPRGPAAQRQRSGASMASAAAVAGLVIYLVLNWLMQRISG